MKTGNDIPVLRSRLLRAIMTGDQQGIAWHREQIRSMGKGVVLVYHVKGKQSYEAEINGDKRVLTIAEVEELKAGNEILMIELYARWV